RLVTRPRPTPTAAATPATAAATRAATAAAIRAALTAAAIPATRRPWPRWVRWVPTAPPRLRPPRRSPRPGNYKQASATPPAAPTRRGLFFAWNLRFDQLLPLRLPHIVVRDKCESTLT
ncbi:MAG: hypothetical protein JZU52_13100, partial [Lamprocystis purpurea]|nr:hypothetical protein [Lamprocystis purpurea]